jgi:hypothetical protein
MAKFYCESDYPDDVLIVRADAAAMSFETREDGEEDGGFNVVLGVDSVRRLRRKINKFLDEQG